MWSGGQIVQGIQLIQRDRPFDHCIYEGTIRTPSVGAGHNMDIVTPTITMLRSVRSPSRQRGPGRVVISLQIRQVLVPSLRLDFPNPLIHINLGYCHPPGTDMHTSTLTDSPPSKKKVWWWSWSWDCEQVFTELIIIVGNIYGYGISSGASGRHILRHPVHVYQQSKLTTDATAYEESFLCSFFSSFVNSSSATCSS